MLSTKLPPLPLMMLQAPVPTVGALPANEVDVTPQRLVWSVPASAVVGGSFTKMLTKSLDAVQGEFEIVHWKI